MAHGLKAKIEGEALALVGRFTVGFEKADAEAVLATLASSTEFTLFGTDADERFDSFEEVAASFRAMTGLLIDARYRWHDDGPSIRTAGEVAWVSGVLNLEHGVAGQRDIATMRSTFVVAPTPAGFRIVHAHFSYGFVPVPACANLTEKEYNA